MSRPLTWVLAAVVAGILVLFVLVSRSAPDDESQWPRSPSAANLHHVRPVELASAAVDEPRALEMLERKPIASEESSASPARWLEQPRPDSAALPEGRIEVRVVCEEDDRHLDRAQVELEYTGPGSWTARHDFGQAHARPLGDADGTFRAGGLRLGEWTVTAIAPGRGPRVERASLGVEQPNAAVVVRLPALRSVRVRVVDGSGATATAESLGIDTWMADMLCVAADAACGRPGNTFRSDGTLLYRARGSGAGILSWNLEVTGQGPACVHLLRGDSIVTARELAFGETEVDLRIDVADLTRDMASCAVSLVDADHGGPLAGALVRFLPTLGPAREARCDPDGRASAGPLPAGEITLHVSAPGYVPLQQAVRIPLSEPIVLRLAAGRRVEGLVLDLAGVPIPNVPVTIQREADASHPRLGMPIPTSVSGPDGRFVFDSLSHETYVVSVRARLRGPPPEDAKAREQRLRQLAQKQQREDASAVESQRVDLRHGDARSIVLRVDREGW